MTMPPPQQRGGQAEIDLILRDCCECDRPEKYDVDTVELRVSDLRGILESHLVAAPPAPVAAGWIRVEDRLPNLHESVVLIDINRWENTPGDLQMNVRACGYLAEVGPVKYWSIRGERATTLDAFTHWAPLVPPIPRSRGEPMKYYLTKYALSNKGEIELVEGSDEPSSGGHVHIGGKFGLYKVGRDVHTTSEDALKAVEAARLKKIASLKKQIAALEKMSYAVKEPRHDHP